MISWNKNNRFHAVKTDQRSDGFPNVQPLWTRRKLDDAFYQQPFTSISDSKQVREGFFD
jgi:hypothetical protein